MQCAKEKETTEDTEEKFWTPPGGDVSSKPLLLFCLVLFLYFRVISHLSPKGRSQISH